MPQDKKEKLFYAGIGARATPPEILFEMKSLASVLEARGFCLRSGGAVGADQAFASGVEESAVIWLPSKNFQWEFQKSKPKHTYKVIREDDLKAFQSIEKFHPRPNKITGFARLLMARNYRTLTDEGKRSSFVVCWTPNGESVGGTSQALRIAEFAGIPIFNLFFLDKRGNP